MVLMNRCHVVQSRRTRYIEVYQGAYRGPNYNVAITICCITVFPYVVHGDTYGGERVEDYGGECNGEYGGEYSGEYSREYSGEYGGECQQAENLIEILTVVLSSIPCSPVL